MSRILVVEDDAANRALLQAVLATAGYKLLMAVDGRAGVELARCEKPDLILMDVMLPLMNGYEATHCIKQDPATRHIPIVAITANDSPRERERALDAGCDGYIAKPIDTELLPTQVDLFLH